MSMTDTKPGPGQFGPLDILGHRDMRKVVRRFTPAVLGLLAAAFFAGGGALALAGGFAFGLLWWTFLEYLLHRWLLHWEPSEPKWKAVRAALPGHRSHHDHPHDPDDVVSVKHWFGIPLCAILFGVMMLAGFPVPFALAALAGGAFGYAAYEYAHFASHHLRTTSRYARMIRQHHALHHFRDETVNFGVTSPLWDWIFGTSFRPERPRG